MRWRSNLSRSSLLSIPLMLYAGILLALSLLHVAGPRSSGPVALTLIFAPYLFIPLLTAIPFALARRHRGIQAAVLVCALVWGARFGSAVVSLPVRSETTDEIVTALTWNLELNNRQFEVIIATLVEYSPDVIALQELTFTQAEILGSNDTLRRQYPYQLLSPTRGVRGMGLLSRYPITESTIIFAPSLQSARLDVDGQIVNVVNAHPSRASFRLPTLYDATRRDLQMHIIRARIDELLEQGEPLLVMGDFNVTDREPTYHLLSARLQDAHLLVGHGTGHSWRHPRVEWLPFGLLRIDYLFSSSQLRPIEAITDCTPRGSDHCLVRSSFSIRQ